MDQTEKKQMIASITVSRVKETTQRIVLTFYSMHREGILTNTMYMAGELILQHCAVISSHSHPSFNNKTHHSHFSPLLCKQNSLINIQINKHFEKAPNTWQIKHTEHLIKISSINLY